MSGLPTLLKELCPKGITYKKLHDVANYKDGAAHEHIMGEDGQYIVTKVKFISSDGAYKMFSDIRLSPVEKDDVIMVMRDLPNGKSLAKCFLIDKDNTYTINQRVCSLTCDRSLLLPKFLYYVLNSNKQLLKYDTGYNQTHLKKQWILNINVPVPPLPVQAEIIRILDAFNDLIASLRSEYTLRESQYEYCRMKLLTFGDNVPTYKLSDLCVLEKGKTPIQKAIPGEYPMVVTAAARKNCNTYQFDSKTVCIPLVSSRGHGVAALNQVFYQEGKFALGNILCGVTPLDEKQLNAKFLYYYLNHRKDTLLVPLMKGGANVSLTVDTLKGVKISLPRIDQQLEIVGKFEPFDGLLEALASEIDLRVQQYDHYREVVLSFQLGH